MGLLHSHGHEQSILGVEGTACLVGREGLHEHQKSVSGRFVHVYPGEARDELLLAAFDYRGHKNTFGNYVRPLFLHEGAPKAKAGSIVQAGREVRALCTSFEDDRGAFWAAGDKIVQLAGGQILAMNRCWRR